MVIKDLWKPKYCNCVIWGVYAKISYNAKWRIVVSRNWTIKGGGWHLVCVFKDGKIRSYTPLKKTPITSWWQAWTVILFKGRVVNG